MTSSRLHQCPPTVPCPVCAARAVEQLLESGRPRMALQMARGLDDLIVEALGQAMLRGREQAKPRAATVRAGSVVAQP